MSRKALNVPVVSRATVRTAFCLLLALPAAILLSRATAGELLAMDWLRPTGELSVRLMILALLPGPLLAAFPGNRFLLRWIAVRRYLGVAAFAYALLHLAAYVIDMGQLPAMVEELALPGIWTGWLALGLLMPPAAISHDRMMRMLGPNWKRVQRMVYFALALTIAHWLLLDWSWKPVAVHLAPLFAAWTLRALRGRRPLPAKRSSA